MAQGRLGASGWALQRDAAGVNHCLLEVEVLEAPQIRYAQDNQMPIAEMGVRFDGLRPEDPPGQMRVVGFGNLAQDLQNRVQVGERLVLEGRLRINTITRQDGGKEKRAEFTLSRIHPLAAGAGGASPVATAAYGTGLPPAPAAGRSSAPRSSAPSRAAAAPATPPPPVWDSSPLVPQDLVDGDDEIPF